MSKRMDTVDEAINMAKKMITHVGLEVTDLEIYHTLHAHWRVPKKDEKIILQKLNIAPEVAERFK